MKAITKLTGILLISLLATACATTPFKVADKYILDNELSEATDITNFRLDSWESIDSQSLILRTDINNYYLIVLDRLALNLPYAENIGITSTTGMVKNGFDSIIVSDSYGTESYTIHKIYKLKDREQATEIKKRLRSQEADK
ncbi:MAG: DUF6491 family protein [Desulfobacteraceae bacterium]|jgi:hypothetical protein